MIWSLRPPSALGVEVPTRAKGAPKQDKDFGYWKGPVVQERRAAALHASEGRGNSAGIWPTLYHNAGFWLALRQSVGQNAFPARTKGISEQGISLSPSRVPAGKYF